MRLQLPTLLEWCRKAPPRRVAVAAAGDFPVLQALSEAYREGIVQPVLCGDIERIDAAARLHNIDLSPFEIIEADSDRQAVSIAVSLVRSGRAELLMKGHVQTADILRAVLDKESGLFRGGVLSHVAVMDIPQLDRTLLLTDCAVCTYPDLNTKAQLIRNAVTAAHRIGMEHPRVAPLTAVELVNPDMPATLDAAALAAMNARGQIEGCFVDGPMALDVALSPEAAAHKGVRSEAAGQADILLFHNIEAGNAAYKALTVVAGCRVGGVVMGAAVPVVLTSRSDSPESKLFSLALGCACAG